MRGVDAGATQATKAAGPDGPAAMPPLWAFGPFVLDVAEQRLLRHGRPLALNGRPLEVLAALVVRAGRLVEKDALLDAVWGHRHVTESVLKGAVNTLRAALGDDAKAPLYIETVPRRGYRFIAALQPTTPGPAPAASAGRTARAAPAAPAAQGARAASGPGHLPPPAPGLVGREACAARLRALLCEHRLVTLTGLGGVGKTRLALAVAHELDSAPAPGDASADGSWLLRLDALADAAPLVSTLAQALQLGAGAGTSAAALARALAPLQLRLVLDNAEHLAEALASLLAVLLDAAPGLRVLVTSQVPLRLAGEQVLLLAPLALPEATHDAAPDPTGYAAARLFVARVRRLQPDYTPTPAEHADIATLCRALDGVPLALELAAARVPLLGVGGVRARLNQRFELLTRGPRDAAARHRTLAAALDWTCALLSDAERGALLQLALFQGSFTAAAAEALLGLALPASEAGAALDLVEALRERSLLVTEATPEGPRLRLFDSVRRHALQQLAESADGGHAARAHHLAWTLRRFEAAELDDFTVPQLQWLPALRMEVDNLRAALQLALAPAAPAPWLDAGLRLAAASGLFWCRSGLRAEGWRWMQQARRCLDEAEAAGVSPAPATRTLLLHGWGLFVNQAQLGTPAEGLAALRLSRPALQAAHDHRRTYLSLYAERMLLLRLQPGDPAPEQRAQLRAGVQPHWGPVSLRYVAMIEALALRDAGDGEGYERACASAARALRQAGARAEAWPMESAVAQARAAAGRLDEARASLDATLQDVQAAGLLREQLPVLAMAATLHLLRDAGAATLALARQAAQLLHAEQLLWWMADALPWVAWHQGRAADAALLQAWADAQAGARGDHRGPVFAMVRRHLLAQLQGRADAAALQAAARGDALSEDAALALAGLAGS